MPTVYVIHAKGDTPFVNQRLLRRLPSNGYNSWLARHHGQGTFLKRVTLENIGPFDSLSLELDQDWNILLGDNGVGKSSILKAIALGIAGEDAKLYADRLIKSGQTHATVTLETSNGKPYLTEILKTTTGPAQVISKSGRLLEAEGWLTLGFPPLRSMGWEQLRGPQLEEGKRRPVPDDVLPLIMGEPDPRCNRLKQWILNLDYRSAKASEKSHSEFVHFKNIIDQFFAVVGRLAEGVRIEFRQVDADRGRILILTDDGEVPIEALSQGTISLIGWVGVLLQRLHEVFEDLPAFREQYALVLIDEIDAHMHPGWQQKLVRQLKELFPKVQFIATTHSPLVTLTCEPGETLLVQRTGPDGNQVVVQRSDLDVRRWRADQVLTTLFGLESSNPMLYTWMKEYTDLVARDSLNKEQEDRLNYLASMLEIAPPEPFEREEARLAYQTIKKALDEQLARIPKEKLEEIRKEAKVQVLESISRQRRPL
jgi:predicted ATP-binding protein involved in virulence